jgi:hypothetical protein
MNKLLLAIAVATIFSTPALADQGTEQGHKASVKSHSESREKQGEVRASQASDPYWKPCHFSRYGGMNTCD